MKLLREKDSGNTLILASEPGRLFEDTLFTIGISSRFLLPVFLNLNTRNRCLLGVEMGLGKRLARRGPKVGRWSSACVKLNWVQLNKNSRADYSANYLDVIQTADNNSLGCPLPKKNLTVKYLPTTNTDKNKGTADCIKV